MKRSATLLFTLCVGLSLITGLGTAGPQDPQGPEPSRPRAKGKSKARQPAQDPTRNQIPAHAFDVILGRPTPHSVTLSVLADKDCEGSIVYGPRGGPLTRHSAPRRFHKGEPAEVVLAELEPDTAYDYEVRSDANGAVAGTFHTWRTAGQPFAFTLTADTHLDDRVNPALYQRALANALDDAPDFHIDLGDTFMTDKHESREAAAQQYVAQRYYFGQLSRSAPLFLVLGNHDGESPRARGGAGNDLALWSNRIRKRYFPNPEPDEFYTGNDVKDPEAGLLQNYYAWEWSDALFVVLDPFWFSERARGGTDNWKRTLGETQYRWLSRTLAASHAKYKFVFIHHLVGGLTPEGRGGVEVAPYFEWGGKNLDGSDGFSTHRPGWSDPIHRLLVKHRVTAVFHGHDHLYVRQELDGIIYQEVPQPGTRGNNAVRNAAEYGYDSGVIRGSPGHLWIRVEPDQVQIEYIQANLEESRKDQPRSREVVHSYTIRPAPLPEP